jgi:uncharacterized protein (DUF885 family)
MGSGGKSIPTSYSAEVQTRFFATLDQAYREMSFCDPGAPPLVADEQTLQIFPGKVSNGYPFHLNPDLRESWRSSAIRTTQALADLAIDQLLPHDRLVAAQVYSAQQTRLDLLENNEHLRPIDYSSGSTPQRYLKDIASEGVYKEKDFELAMQRAAGWRDWVSNAVEAQNEGIGLHITQPRAVMEQTLKRLDTILTSGELRETYMKPLGLAALKKPLEETYLKSMEQNVHEGYAQLATYIDQTYLAECRDDSHPGLCHLLDGREAYQRLVSYWCAETIPVEPLYHEIEGSFHNKKQELQKIARKHGYSVADFMRYLQQDPSCYPYHSSTHVQQEFESKLSLIQNHLSNLTDYMPPPCEVLMIDTADPAATYKEPIRSTGQPAHIFLPAHPRTYNVHAMLGLAAHEGTPGHHLQLSRQGELERPAILDFFPCPAFREGWAMYSTTLLEEMGIELTDYERAYIVLTSMAIDRGVMLDIGIHHYGWSIDEAKQRRRDLLGYDGPEAERKDILRFVMWPGQIASYTRGWAFKSYENFTRFRLGELYNPREFHTMILDSGEMPIDMLGDHISRWIRQKQNPRNF